MKKDKNNEHPPVQPPKETEPEPGPAGEPVEEPPAEEPPAVEPVEPVQPALPLRVRAIANGYCDNVYRKTGDVFLLTSARQFSAKWMEAVPAE